MPSDRPGHLFRPPEAWPAVRASGEGGEGGQPSWPVGTVLVAMTAAWTVFAWPWLTGRYTIPWDAKAHFAPQIQFLAQSLAAGDSPFWLPYAFSGLPQVADPQSMIFSPPFLLLAVLDGAPSLWAIDVTMLAMLLFAGLSVLWLTRDLGWHWAGGLIAALGFALGAAMAWRLQHFGQVLSLAYLPLAVLLLRRGLIAGSAGYGALAGLVSAFIVLGRDQVGLLGVYLLVAYGVSHILAEPLRLQALRRAVPPLAAGSLIGGLIAGLPLLLTILYAEQSNRPEIDLVGAGRGSLHPALLLTAVVPHLYGAASSVMGEFWGPPSYTWAGTDLYLAQNMGQCYIGAVPLLLLIVGLMRGRLLDREIRFFTLALVAVVLYALGWFTPAFRLMYETLPGVSLFRRPADAVFLIGGLASLIAGYVAHLWLNGGLEPPRPRQRIGEAAVVSALLALGLAFALAYDRLGLALRPLALAACWLLAAALALKAAGWLAPIRPLAAGLMLAALTAGDLAINNGPNGATAMAPQELEMLEPASRNETITLLKQRVRAATTETERPRVELAGLGFHWPNSSLPHRLEHVLGYNPVRPALYAAATGAGDTVGLAEQRQFSPLMPGYRSTLADLLGLRFIATGVPAEKIDSRLQPGDLTLIARTRDAYVYENPRARPRLVLATAALAADHGAILKTGAWPDADLATTVLLEAAPAQPAALRRPGTSRIVSYRNGEVVIEATSPDGGWVVLADPWHPWWRARIDGAEAALQRANVLFRAVEVPAGHHRIAMTFEPLAGAWRDLADRLGGRPRRSDNHSNRVERR